MTRLNKKWKERSVTSLQGEQSITKNQQNTTEEKRTENGAELKIKTQRVTDGRPMSP